MEKYVYPKHLFGMGYDGLEANIVTYIESEDASDAVLSELFGFAKYLVQANDTECGRELTRVIFVVPICIELIDLYEEIDNHDGLFLPKYNQDDLYDHIMAIVESETHGAMNMFLHAADQSIDLAIKRFRILCSSRLRQERSRFETWKKYQHKLPIIRK